MSKRKGKYRSCCNKHGKHHEMYVLRFHSILGIEEPEEEPEIVNVTEEAEEAQKAEPEIAGIDYARCTGQSKEAKKTQNLRNGTRMFRQRCTLHCLRPFIIRCITTLAITGLPSGEAVY